MTGRKRLRLRAMRCEPRARARGSLARRMGRRGRPAAPSSRQKKPGPFGPGELNREASRLGDVGSEDPFQALRLEPGRGEPPRKSLNQSPVGAPPLDAATQHLY